MKTIHLTKGEVTIVDDEDFDWLSNFSWYLHTNTNGRKYARCETYPNGVKTTWRMHRVILNAPKSIEVDHIDGNGLNNMKRNLRFCTKSLNHANTPKFRTYKGELPSSKFKGVSWNKNVKRWTAHICVNNECKFLGYFTNEMDAAKEYDRVANLFFGSYSKPNF
jgi:hypothetical protein